MKFKNLSRVFLFFFSILFYSCNEDNTNANSSKKNYVSIIDYKVIAKDSFAAPFVIPIDDGKLIKRKLAEPRVTETNSNVVPAGKPSIIKPTRIIISSPGDDSTALPNIFPRNDSVFKPLEPEIVEAKDMGNKDQNPANFSYFSTLQGLKHDVFRTLFQDSRANIWFASWGGGLSKYDGKYFSHYTKEQGLPDNAVISVYEDSKANMWFGTYLLGIIKYDGKNFNYIYLPNTPKSNVIWEFKENSDGDMWVATGGGGVWKITKDSLYQYTTESGIAHNYVNHVNEDNQGRIWICTMEGVSVYQDNSFTTYQFEKEATNSILLTEQTSDNSIWLGTWDDGLVRYDGEEFYHYSKEQGLTDLAIGEIIEGGDGKIWKVSYGGGLTSYDGKNFTTYTEEHGLGNNFLLGMLKDRDSKLWLATQRAGVNRYNGDLFTHYRENEGLSKNSVRSLYEDENGHIWMGTFDGGIDIYDGKSFKNYSKDQGLLSNQIYDIYEDRSGTMWIVDGESGISKLKDNIITNYHNLIGKVGGFKAMEDSRGDLWMLSYEKGVFQFHNDSIFVHKIENGQLTNNNRCILEDSLGRIWIGSAGGGIIIMEEDSLRYIRKENLNGRVVNTMLRDHENRIWAGTWEGLNIIEDDKIYQLNSEDGLLGKTVESIIQDSIGNIWLGTSAGLNKIDIKDYEAIFQAMNNGEDLSEMFFFKKYTYSDGFLGVGCNRNSMIEDSEGNIWIGARDRLTVYHPQGDTPDTLAPNMELRNVSLYNESIPWDDFIDNDSSFTLSNGVNIHSINLSSTSNWNALPLDLSLPYDNNYLNFEFIGITMNKPEKVVYHYMMEGLEDQWNQSTSRNFASYGNMPFGDYVFKVQSRNSSGIWSEIHEFPFEIRPPWWHTWWARIGFFLLIVFTFVAQSKYRTRNLKIRQEELIREVQVATKEIEEQNAEIERNHKEMDQFKTRFFTNITHEFRTPLTVILGLAEELGKNNKTAELIKRNGQRLLNLINQILDLSKLESGRQEVDFRQLDIVKFLNYLSDSYKSLIDSKNLKYSFNSDSKELLMDVDESKLQSLFGNLISNAIKYTPEGGSIEVNLKNEIKRVIISIRDMGPGIPEDAIEHIFDRFYQVEGQKTQQIGSGVGLALCREITKVLKGDISVRNHPDGGAEFKLTLPIHNEAPIQNDLTQIKIIDKSETEAEEIGIEETEDPDSPIVLLVEDEPDIRSFVKTFLKDSFNVIFAVNGKEGLEKAFELVPDIIISDVMMPVMDGLEFTNGIKQDIRTSHIPVIMLTAKIDIESRLAGLKEGADVYLPKPFNKEELILHLRNFLSLRESIHKQFSSGDSAINQKLPEKENAFLTSIKELIQEHLDESSFGIKELCSEIGISRMQLHRKLKALSGKSTTEFINDYRIDEAVKLLLNSDLNISEIAYSSGFENPDYFSRLFTKKYQKSPSQYKSEFG